MNILLIDQGLPHSVYSGKTVRLKNIYEGLAKKHSIVFLRTAESEIRSESEELRVWADRTFKYIVTLPSLGKTQFGHRLQSALRGRPWYDILSKYPDQVPSLSDDMNQLLSLYGIDLAITFCIETAPYGKLISKRVPWILDLGDSTILQLRREERFTISLSKRFRIQMRQFRESHYEKESIQSASNTIFVAEDDAKVHPELDNRMTVVPIGVDPAYFDPDAVTPHKEERPYVVFTGHMSFLPNQDAAIYFSKNILPLCREKLPQLEFKIVGADPSAKVVALKQIQGVEVTGAVPDLRPFLAGAEAFVCPMRMGSGIKNKLLEAMSMAVPIVSSPLGLSGITGIPADSVDCYEDERHFANAIHRIIENPKTYKETGRKLRSFVELNHSWDRVVTHYEALFERTMRTFKVAA